MSEIQTEQPTCVFVVRLWQEWSLTIPHWRGRVVHLESGQTAAFQDWDQLTAFLQEWSQGSQK